MTELNGDTTKLRLFAAGVDNLFGTILCLFIASRLPGIESPLVRWEFGILAYLGYFLVLEATWHTTLGKWLFGLTVVRLDSGAVSWEEAGWRTLLRIVEVNPILLGMLPGALAVRFTKRKQRLGDLLAGTIVVRRTALEAEVASRVVA
jgi:uncharacterized RDD family membrane protein YckC